MEGARCGGLGVPTLPSRCHHCEDGLTSWWVLPASVGSGQRLFLGIGLVTHPLLSLKPSLPHPACIFSGFWPASALVTALGGAVTCSGWLYISGLSGPGQMARAAGRV